MKGHKSPHVVISWGELFDKITILRIKSKKILDDNKLRNVFVELMALEEVIPEDMARNEEIKSLVDQLSEINLRLWDIEDKKRACEKDLDFGEAFIKAAREVYLSNDIRAKIKKDINILTGSKIVEEKSYDYL